MKKYLQNLKVNLASQLEYRSDLIVSFILKAAIILAFSFLWVKISDEGGEIAGYGLSGIILYYILTQVFDGLYSSRITKIIKDDVLLGDLSNKLVKPVRALPYYFTLHLSRVLSETIMYTILVIPVFILKPSFLGELNLDLISILYLVISFMLAGFLGFFIFFLSGCVAFWTKEAGGIQAVVKNVMKFFVGALIPIDLLPEMFQKIILLTPFPYILYYPAKVMLTSIEFPEMIRAIAIMLFWIVSLFLLTVKVWSAGLREYEAVGN